MGKKRSKRPFTLLEILITLTLIGVGLGALAMQVSKVINGEKFERGVDQIISRLSLAQELMLDYRMDVRVQLTRQKGIVMCSIETDRPLPKRLERAIERHKEIPGIQAFYPETCTLHFDGTVGTTPQGSLTLRSQNKEATLTLTGYPTRIKRGTYVQQNTPPAVYPEEILSAL